MTAPATVTAFVNEYPVRVAAGVSALEAVAAVDPELAAGVRSGAARLTDGRGIPLDPATAVFAGAILRAVVSARGGRNEADAHA